jgi:hypothetical protein
MRWMNWIAVAAVAVGLLAGAGTCFAQPDYPERTFHYGHAVLLGANNGSESLPPPALALDASVWRLDKYEYSLNVFVCDVKSTFERPCHSPREYLTHLELTLPSGWLAPFVDLYETQCRQPQRGDRQ